MLATPPLHTKHLMLRPPEEGDLLPIAKRVNNPRIVRNLGRAPWPYTLDDARRFFEYVRTLRKGEAVFVMVEASQGPLGLIGYETMGHTVGVELGYWLAENFWSRGLVTEAADVVLDHAFEVSRHSIVHARCRLDNAASGRVLRKLGFRFTGIGPCLVASLATWVRCQVFELTAKEWARMRSNKPNAARPAP